MEFYDNPLIERYASAEMCRLWGPLRKFRTWRWLWVQLAEVQAELGLPISAAQIAELKTHVDNIDFAAAERYERELRHDVMAHVHAYGDSCPSARGIVHLGATSCYVTDNADLILLREGLEMIAAQLAAVVDSLAKFAADHRGLACLGYTHLQPAQPTTVGKRACLWIYDLVQDLAEIERRRDLLLARGAKGTTGTQASFLELFGGDHARVRELDARIARRLGFPGSYPVTGQTYSRKVDSQILAALSGVAQSAHKAGSDLRLLQSFKEIEEPFETSQIGSSAMAYKRNPMRAERMCALSRFVISLESNAANTMATQWFERTLDDSANRRLAIPQSFLATDAILRLYRNIAGGLVVYPQVIAQRLAAELPFMATENVLMAAVAKGGDRQDLHERIRQHSQAAGARVKQHGAANDLAERLQADPAFAGIDWPAVLAAEKFVGRAPEQVDEFLRDIVEPVRRRYSDQPVGGEDVRV